MSKCVEIPCIMSVETDDGIELHRTTISNTALKEVFFAKPVKLTNDGFVEIIEVNEPQYHLFTQYYRLIWKVNVKYINKLYSTDYAKAVTDFLIADYTAAIELENKTRSCEYAKRGKVYACKKEYDKAIADMREAVQINGTDFYERDLQEVLEMARTQIK